MPLPHIFIATPTPGSVKTGYMKCVLATMMELGARGIQSDFASEEGSVIEMQRDMLATRFLNGPWSHILFVDSDMMFPHDLCSRMLATNKPLIGAAYAARRSNGPMIEEAMKRGLSFNEASLFGCDWQVFALDDSSPIIVKDGIMQVRAVPFGFTLIQRVVFETMVSSGVAKQQKITNTQVGAFYNFFLPHPEIIKRGQHISEDISFCRRWQKDCHGEVWTFTDAAVYHIGEFGFGGSYFAYLQAVKRLTEP